jgi:hypothetical protein
VPIIGALFAVYGVICLISSLTGLLLSESAQKVLIDVGPPQWFRTFSLIGVAQAVWAIGIGIGLLRWRRQAVPHVLYYFFGDVAVTVLHFVAFGLAGQEWTYLASLFGLAVIYLFYSILHRNSSALA